MRADAEASAVPADLGLLEVGEIAALFLIAANILASLLREDLLSQNFTDGGKLDLQLGSNATARPERQQCGRPYVPSRHSAISFSSMAPALTSRQSASVTSTVVAPCPEQSPPSSTMSTRPSMAPNTS